MEQLPYSTLVPGEVAHSIHSARCGRAHDKKGVERDVTRSIH